ncbi:CopG family ribbon-helix-helix protein [Telmatobacter bradus]|uniref:CopG family ribbon-helix-helix protein n=1 Tax=Telmatobacter bradus TaxID=474953 RepID=UPI003B42DE29
MAEPRTISFRIDANKVEALDKLAQAMDRDRSYLLNRAVEGYLAEQQRFAAMVEEGIDDLKAGRFIPHEEVGALLAGWEKAGQ